MLQNQQFQVQQRLASRKQDLIEREFEAQQGARDRKVQAIAELGDVTMAGLGTVPARLMATIDPGSIKNMISAFTTLKTLEAKPAGVNTKLGAREIQIMREIQKQQAELSQQTGQPVTMEETPMFQLFIAEAPKLMSKEEMEQKFAIEMSRNQITGMRLANEPEKIKTAKDMAEAFFQKTEFKPGTQPVGTEKRGPDTGANFQNQALNVAEARFKAANQPQ